MDWYFIIKTLHIIGSTVLFGTGLGIAFFMLRSHFTDNIHENFSRHAIPYWPITCSPPPRSSSSL